MADHARRGRRRGRWRPTGWGRRRRARARGGRQPGERRERDVRGSERAGARRTKSVRCGLRQQRRDEDDEAREHEAPDTARPASRQLRRASTGHDAEEGKRLEGDAEPEEQRGARRPAGTARSMGRRPTPRGPAATQSSGWPQPPTTLATPSRADQRQGEAGPVGEAPVARHRIERRTGRSTRSGPRRAEHEPHAERLAWHVQVGRQPDQLPEADDGDQQRTRRRAVTSAPVADVDVGEVAVQDGRTTLLARLHRSPGAARPPPEVCTRWRPSRL